MRLKTYLPVPQFEVVRDLRPVASKGLFYCVDGDVSQMLSAAALLWPSVVRPMGSGFLFDNMFEIVRGNV